MKTTSESNRPSYKKSKTIPETSTPDEETVYNFTQSNNDSVSDGDDIDLMLTQTDNGAIINETFEIVSTNTETTTVDPKDVEELELLQKLNEEKARQQKEAFQLQLSMDEIKRKREETERERKKKEAEDYQAVYGNEKRAEKIWKDAELAATAAETTAKR